LKEIHIKETPVRKEENENYFPKKTLKKAIFGKFSKFDNHLTMTPKKRKFKQELEGSN